MFFSDGRHFKLRYALTVAKQIYGEINEQKEHLEWPLVRRTGKTWFPTAKWVGSWFAGIGWKPRKATKKRKATSAQDCAAMQKYCDFLRYVIQCPPPQADAALEPHMDWGQMFDSTVIRWDCSLTSTGTQRHGLLRKSGPPTALPLPLGQKHGQRGIVLGI